jgi:2-polyprenyl-6-hydroxyphenyl methylase/3-demethylubiquinone-9 3-methyltransferase
MQLKNLETYPYNETTLNHTHKYLAPYVLRLLREEGKKNIFEIGCGNGSFAAFLYDNGFHITGVDASYEGICLANKTWPYIPLFQDSVYEELENKYGKYPVVLSLEVVEHLYFPKSLHLTFITC